MPSLAVLNFLNLRLRDYTAMETGEDHVNPSGQQISREERQRRVEAHGVESAAAAALRAQRTGHPDPIRSGQDRSRDAPRRVDGARAPQRLTIAPISDAYLRREAAQAATAADRAHERRPHVPIPGGCHQAGDALFGVHASAPRQVSPAENAEPLRFARRVPKAEWTGPRLSNEPYPLHATLEAAA